MERDYNLQIVKNTKSQEPINSSAWQADFSEGNLIYYKEFDAANKSVAYEFGFGLSYSTFELTHLGIEPLRPNTSRAPNERVRTIPGGNEEL